MGPCGALVHIRLQSPLIEGGDSGKRRVPQLGDEAEPEIAAVAPRIYNGANPLCLTLIRLRNKVSNRYLLHNTLNSYALIVFLIGDGHAQGFGKS